MTNNGSPFFWRSTSNIAQVYLKYTTVLTLNAELLLRTPLQDLIGQLDPGQFWQVYRGSQVNVRQIIAAHHNLLGRVTLTLRDRSEKIYISRSYAHLFRLI